MLIAAGLYDNAGICGSSGVAYCYEHWNERMGTDGARSISVSLSIRIGRRTDQADNNRCVIGARR